MITQCGRIGACSGAGGGDVRIGACIGVGGNNHLQRRCPKNVTLEHRQLGAKRVARLHGSNARRRVSLGTSTRPFGGIRDAARSLPPL